MSQSGYASLAFPDPASASPGPGVQPDAQPGAPVAMLVYRSRAVSPLSNADLYRLAADAQSRNRREQVTGLLLYDDRRFFQWLEGPAEGVARIMRSIRNDPRHTDIQIIEHTQAERRMFGDWNMKLATPGPMPVLWRDEILEPPDEVIEGLRRHPETAAALLIKLLPPSSAGRERTVPAEPDDAPLGHATAAILKDLVSSVVLPRVSDLHFLPEHPRASELVDLLIAPDEAAARELIEELRMARGTIPPLYATLFEPAARRLGDLWAEDACSEFEVTLGLCRMQTAIRLLGRDMQPSPAFRPSGATVLIAPEPGEIHRLGAALDQEVLWNAGWAPRCEYPSDDRSLQELVSSTWFDALDLSLSAAFQRRHWLPRLARTIAGARRASRNPSLLVIVGGRVFVEDDASRDAVGADVASMTALTVGELILRGIAARDAALSRS